MRKGIVALIGVILTLVFVLVGLFGVWYGASMEGGGYKMKADAYLTKDVITESNIPLIPAGEYASDSRSSNEKSIFDNTMYITVVVLVMAILALVAVLGFVFNFGKSNMMRMLGAIFGIITFVLALVAILYFMTALPAEMNNYGGVVEKPTFWYNQKIQGVVDVSMGPGYAWYLMLVTAIIALITSIMLLIFKEKQVLPTQQMP